MDNLKIKTEDTTDEKVSLNIEKPGIDKNVVINCNIYKNDDIQVKPVKEEECEDENVDRSFETIFLPDMYEGVAVETPFFDLNKYKEIRGIPAEDHEICSNITDNINTYNSENYFYRCIKIDNRQMNNENVYFYSPISNSYLNTNLDGSFKLEPEWNSRIPMHNLHVNFNIHPQTYYLNSRLASNIHQCEKIVEYNKNNDSLPRRNNATESADFVSINRLSKLVDTRIREVTHVVTSDLLPSDKSIETVSTNLSEFNNDFSNQFIRRIKRGEAEEAPYKCPKCKRPRLFSTLTAVNNHLKFDHITVFRNTVGKLRAVRLPQKTKAQANGINVNSI